MEPISKKLGATLLIVIAFSLPFPLSMEVFEFAGNNFVMNFVITIAIALLFPIISGLITKDKRIPYFVSTVGWLVSFAFSSFPFRYSHWSGWISPFFLSVPIGITLGAVSSVISMDLHNLKLSRNMITKKRMLVSGLFTLTLAISYVVYSHLEGISSYLDEHTWVVTIISIIITFVLTVTGWSRFHERRWRKR